MGDTLSKAAIGLLAFFVGTGVLLVLGLLWVIASWGDDELPFD